MAEEAGSRRALIIEDDPALCRLILRLLRDDGYEAESVGDAAAAFAALEELTPDIILLDVTLPGVDGIEICRTLRAREATRLTPILLVTASDTPAMRHEGLEAGADGFLGKPFRPDELRARMQTAIRLRGARRRDR